MEKPKWTFWANPIHQQVFQKTQWDSEFFATMSGTWSAFHTWHNRVFFFATGCSRRSQRQQWKMGTEILQFVNNIITSGRTILNLAIVSPRGILAMSGDVLGCPSWGTVPLTSSGWRLECYLACHGAQDRPTALNVLSTEVENCSGLSRSIFSFNTKELRPQPPAIYRWSYASLNLKTHSEMQATSPHHVSGVALSSGDSLLGSRTFSTWQTGSISAFPIIFLGDSEIRSKASGASLVVKNLSASAGDTGLIPGPEKSHVPRGNWKCGHSCRVCALEPVLCNKGSHCNKKPLHRRETVPLLTATKEKLVQQQRLSAAK